jgi:FkbM family methyltransferase
MKLKEIPYFLGLRPAPRSYPYELRGFALPKDGTVSYAQWLHPRETKKEITQDTVEELRKFLSPGDVAIDIGAHTGDSTLPVALAVGPAGCVLALEPNPYVFSVLAKNAELNPSKSKIIPLMFAAASEDAELEFRYSDAGFCNGGQFAGISRWVHGHAFTLTVQGKNLQKFLQENYSELIPRIRYIKMDTEGNDLGVVQSLSNLISQYKPFLRMEVYGRLDKSQRRELFQSVARHGYIVYRIADEGNYRGEPLTEQDLLRWRHFDIFCVPSP